MRNTLTVKIWLAFSLVSLLLYLVVILITPTLIRNYFTDALMEPAPPSQRNIIETTFSRGPHIRGFILLEDGTTIPSNAKNAFSQTFINEIKQNIENQKSPRQMYESVNRQGNIRYVITRDVAYGHSIYQIMFLRKPEEDLYVRHLLFNIMLYVGTALVVSWFASLLIVRYLTRPLTQMEQHVKHIANRNWNEPLDIKRDDEIGKLATSINTMRQQLIQQDETQQSMLQNISHELKTPVMVIRSYAQAIQDGIYPNGDLAGSVKVIDEEGERLEKLTKQLLYLTRLDYLANRKQEKNDINLEKLIDKIVQRMSLKRPEITWQIELKPVIIKGDEETIRVMIENILDNHLRYAERFMEIKLMFDSIKSELILYFWNDGIEIEAHTLNQIFNPFNKGREGKSGLGLTIVQRIMKIYQGKITLENERNGVSTSVRIPLNE